MVLIAERPFLFDAAMRMGKGRKQATSALYRNPVGTAPLPLCSICQSCSRNILNFQQKALDFRKELFMAGGERQFTSDALNANLVAL
jgi:hypothetical protein